jgi:hypothetical protein
MWSFAGFILALAVAVASWRCSRSPGGFYDREVYGMNAAAHRRYAVVSLVFATVFAFAYGRRLEAAGIAALALYALIAIFYAASFLRGASDE